MNKNIRRGAARLALVPVAAVAAPLTTIMLPAGPAAATSESPTPTPPAATEVFDAKTFIVDVAVTGDRLDVLTDRNSVTRIEGGNITTIDFEADIASIDADSEGQLHGFVEADDGGQLVTIADDGTLTAVGDPVSFDSDSGGDDASLKFDPNGTATVTFSFNRLLDESPANFVRMTEDGGWDYFALPQDDAATVGVVPQSDGSVLFRSDFDGDLRRFTPGDGAELVADLPDGLYLGSTEAPDDLAGTADGTVYFMNGSDIERRLPSGEIMTVGTVDVEFDDFEFDLLRFDFDSPRIFVGTEGRLYLAMSTTVFQLDMDITGPVITVTGVKDGATLVEGKVGKVDIGCEDSFSVTACITTLDGKIVDTVTPSALGRGRHRLVVDATDGFGNTSSKTIEFDVAGKHEITGDLAGSTGSAGTVARLYMAVFSRQPDGAGQGYWVAQHQGGATLQTIAKMFVTSPEFRETYDDLDDDEFLTVLYRNVMDREPDAGGLAYWQGLMDSGLSRAEVTLWFAESAEFQRLTFTS